MKRLFALVMAAVLLAVPALAIETSTGLDIDINVEEFKPLIWLCDSRAVYDDAEEPGRTTDGGEEMTERQYNYAFEGEQIVWTVLVMDKNKIQEIKDVYVILAATEGSEVGDFVVECVEDASLNGKDQILDSCNARIGQEALTEFDPNIMAYYTCTMTVEPKDSMYQEYWVNIVAESEEASGMTEYATIDEDEYWFFNPVVGITISDPITFNEVKNGVVSYSNTVLVENDADPDSGVHMEMFIGGQDFRPGPGEDGTCYNPNTPAEMSNYLTLGNGDHKCDMPAAWDGKSPFDSFCYYAVNGAYSTADITGLADAEGYLGIPRIRNEYGILDAAELIGEDFYLTKWDGTTPIKDAYDPGNVLGPGDEVSLTLKLMIPEPCTGSFSDGAINIYGEAI